MSDLNLENPFFSESDESSDDSDVMIVVSVPGTRRHVTRPNIFEELSEYEFRLRFRLLKVNILHLVELLDPLLAPRPRSNKHAVSTMDQVLITMRYL